MIHVSLKICEKAFWFLLLLLLLYLSCLQLFDSLNCQSTEYIFLCQRIQVDFSSEQGFF